MLHGDRHLVDPVGQTWVPNDSATVTSGGGSTLTGTLTLSLYDNATCDAGTADANVLYREAFTLTGATSPATRTTTNGDGNGAGLAADEVFNEARSPVNVSWRAVFDSPTNSTDATGPCETSTGLVIDDNDPTRSQRAKGSAGAPAVRPGLSHEWAPQVEASALPLLGYPLRYRPNGLMHRGAPWCISASYGFCRRPSGGPGNPPSGGVWGDPERLSRSRSLLLFPECWGWNRGWPLSPTAASSIDGACRVTRQPRIHPLQEMWRLPPARDRKEAQELDDPGQLTEVRRKANSDHRGTAEPSTDKEAYLMKVWTSSPGRSHKLRAGLGLLFSVLMLAMIAVPSALAVHDDGLFELDKNASDDLNVTVFGTLAANVSSTATQLKVCRTAATNPAAGEKLMIDAEQFSVTPVAGSFGGSCSGTKVLYNVTRGAGATAHSGGASISLLSTVAADDTDDWDSIYSAIQGGDDDCSDLGAVACSFVADPQFPTDTSIFTTGGSKDDLEIQGNPGTGWKWTTGSVPDADEILNAYAAKYVKAADSHQILYFGADRYATNGSKDFGFWFFHKPVGTNADGTFSGSHTLPDPDTGARGDILILGTFTQGGAASNVRVFEWVGTGGNATQTGTVSGPVGAFGDCVPGSAGDNGCGTVNSASIPVPWGYQAKGTVSGGFIPSGGFVEGGIDLTALGLEGCFSTFVAETRSSPSVDAQLKDFALGEFEACGSDLTTTPSDNAGTHSPTVRMTETFRTCRSDRVRCRSRTLPISSSPEQARGKARWTSTFVVQARPPVTPTERSSRHTRSTGPPSSRSFRMRRRSRRWERTAGQASSLLGQKVLMTTQTRALASASRFCP